MASLASQQSAPKRGSRHPLLLHQRFSEVNFWTCLLIMAAAGALLVWNPARLEPYRPHLSMILAATGLILVLSFAFRLRSFAQCRENGLRIQFPLYRLTIPYEDIRASRPSDFYRVFPPREQPRIQRHFLETLLAKTVVVLELGQLPRSRSWLRLWMSRYMLSPESEDLVLPVRDWIAFRAELDDFRSRYRTYRY